MDATRRVGLVVLLGLLFSSLLLAAPNTASADRCQPEELILVEPGEGPMDERDSPICAVTDYYVYPFICDEPRPLMDCLSNLQIDDEYRPPLIPPYRPNAFRIYCNAYEWTWQQLGQTAACQF